MSRVACVIAALSLAACGARSGLEEPSPAEADAGSAANATPPGFARWHGIWRFHTVRALCDTLAIAFCDAQVRVRFSADDLCDGANPLGAAPSVARVEWLGDSEARLTADIEGADVTVRVALSEATDPRDDALRLVSLEGPAGDETFPWDAGRRDIGPEPLPASFIGCD